MEKKKFSYIENIVVTFLDSELIWPEVHIALEKFKKSKKNKIENFFARSSKFRKKSDQEEVVESKQFSDLFGGWIHLNSIS